MEVGILGGFVGVLGTQLSREEMMLSRKWTELKDRETEHEKKKWCKSPGDAEHCVMTSASVDYDVNLTTP